MSILSRSALAGVAIATLLASSARASMIYAGPGPDRSLALNFSSGPILGTVIFDGYRTLDGKNFYQDDSSPKLTNNGIFSTAFDLDDGGKSGAQANFHSNPSGGTVSSTANNGAGVSSTGGKEAFSFGSSFSSGGKEAFSLGGIPLDVALNNLALSLNGNHPGFEEIGRGGVGSIEKGSISATPLPPSWTMMLIGVAGFGFVAYRRKSKPALRLA